MTNQSTTTEAALEACPFCGAAAFISWDGDVNSPDDWSANCDNTLDCGATVGGMNSEAAAINAWNSRIPAPSVAPVVTLTEDEISVLTDYHYYEAEKAVTRRGDRAGEQGHLQRLAILRAAPASPVAPVEQSNEDPHPGFDCGGTCVIHCGRFAPAPASPAATTQPSTLAKAAAEEIVSKFPELREHDKWVTLGRVRIDIETETETFEPATTPKLPVEDQIAAIIERCFSGDGEQSE